MFEKAKYARHSFGDGVWPDITHPEPYQQSDSIPLPGKTRIIAHKLFI